jgi:hypothetical protein
MSSSRALKSAGLLQKQLLWNSLKARRASRSRTIARASAAPSRRRLF